MSNDYTPRKEEAFALPPVPDHPESCIADYWSPYELSAISAYGHACAEAALAPLVEENAILRQQVLKLGIDNEKLKAAEELSYRAKRIVIDDLCSLRARVAELEAENKLLSEDLDSTESERVRLRADLAAKAGEVEALRGFAKRVMSAWPDGGLDGGELQDAAHAAGLLAPVTATEPCGESCSCAEWGEWPIECYRKTDLLKGTGPWVNPLATEVEKYRADAERWQLARTGYPIAIVDRFGDYKSHNAADHEADSAIDAARKGEGSEG